MSVDLEALKQFLIARKYELVDLQKKQINKRIKELLESQVRLIESILIFLSKQTTGEIDMAKLKLSLDNATMSIDEIRSRQNKRTSDDTVTQAVLELVNTIPEGEGRLVNAPNVNTKTVAATVHRLVKTGQLPKNIAVMTAKNGKEAYIVKEKVEA